MSHDETEPMYGWLICRFDRKQIHSILYGQFSRQATPPTSGWVFLAKNAAEPIKNTDIMKLPREGLDGQNLALFAKGIDPDDIAACLGTSAEGEGIAVNAAFLQNDRDPTAPATRYYVLRNCGIPAVNGRYMEGGFHEDAPLYRNVREWAIVRTKLKEIPELGINAKGSYAIQEGASISELYHEAAAEAYSDLLTPGSSDSIRDGSYHFKKRFMALSRAGNRMVTGDQSLQLDFINRKRAALRSEISANLLLSLQDVHIDSAAHELASSGIKDPQQTAHELASSESKDPQQPVQLSTIVETGRTRQVSEDSAADKSLTKTTVAGELFSRSQVANYMNETLESCAPDTIKTGFSTAPNSPSSATLDPASADAAGSSSGDEGELGEEGLGGRVSVSAPPDRASRQASTAAQKPALEATEVAVETDITLGRSISYQRASQGYVLNRLSQDDPNSSSNSNNNNSSSGYGAVEVPEEDLAYVDAEAELAREVTLCIEEREAALTALRWEASRLRRAYIDGTESAAFSQFNQSMYSAGDAPRSPFSTAPPSQFNSVALYSAAGTKAPPAEFYQSRIEELLERMREVRRLSLAFADAFAAWARLLHKQKAARWRREKKKAEQFGASYHRMNRTYAVVLAQRSAKELYAQSQAVKSTVKKFSRGMEPVKYATDISLVGIFDTREEAEAAFEQAFNAIPQEYMLLPELQAVNKKLTGLRRCGQHYWVHSSSVPQDLECEQCRLQKQQQMKAASGVPELYKEEPVSQFIWQGHNYLEKMWSDTSFLAEVEYLRRALPEENFAANPLLLSNASVQELLDTMHEHKYGSKTLQTHSSKQRATSSSAAAAPLTTSTAQSSRHPLNALRGKKELLRNAAKAGDAYNAHIKQRDYDAKYIDNPYNNTANFGRIGRQKTSSEHSDNCSYGSEEHSPLQQPGSPAPSMASAPGFYATSSSARHAGSVFNESASSAAESEYGQPVTGNSSAAPSQATSVQSQLRLGLDSSLQTTAGSSRTAMRASQSAPYFSSTSDQATAGMGPRSTNRPAELNSRTIAAYTSKSAAAGSGAVGARSAARNRTTAAGDGSVLTTEAGLDLNRHLPAELRTGRALPPLSQSAVRDTGTLQSRRTIWGDRRWDRDFLGDDAEQRERLSRALQVIGQCPVPDNAIQSDPAATTGGEMTGTFGTAGPEEWARTVPGSPNRTAASMQSTAHNIILSSSPITTLLGAQTQQDGRSQALSKQNLVEAFYSYRGAQMSLLQERVPVAHRTEEIFCRTDVGEFAGLTKGRALRAFDFQQQLFKTGKEKEQHRKHMQQLLRAAVAVDIIHCDVPYIQRLVQHATAMNASMLELDIAQASVFLRHFAVTCKYALRGQAWYRGDRDRKRVAEIRRKIKAQKRHRRTTEIEAAALALTWVPSLLNECVQKCVRRERRSVFRFTVNMSGVLCMVSLRRQASPSRKPLSPMQLCAGCNTATIITKFEPADRSYSTHRAPCTCVFLSPQEQWQLNIYNPLLRENFPHLLSVAQVRQMLRGIERAALAMRSQDYAQRALVGASFGDLQPLFLYGAQEAAAEGDDDAFNGRRLDRSFSNALMRAALESAVLPRLPLRLPDQVSHIIATPGQHQYIASDYVRTTSTTTGKMIGAYHHSVMTDCDRPGAATDAPTGELQWNWHPLVDAVRVRNEIARTKMLSEQLRCLAEQAALLVQCRRTDREALYMSTETASIEFEDARSAVLRVSERILIAAERIADVMKFSRRLEADMYAEEQGQQLDDRQSYEAVESANTWIGLNEKRKLEAQHEVMFADCQQKAVQCGTVYKLYESASAALQQAEEHHVQCVLQYEQHFPFIAQKQRELREMQIYTRAAADAVLRTYSMPRRIPPYPIPRKHTAQEGMQVAGRYTSARRLQRVPWNLVFVRDPLERLRLDNRGALAVLQKRVMKLRPLQRTLDGRLKPYLRCVVLVLLDELTGYMVVHVGQEAASVEEANQHTDLQLQKSDFSDLTSHGLDGDIILRPEDVDWVLSVPVEFSAENLRRAEKCAKGGGQFQLDPNKLSAGASACDLAVVLPSQALRPVLAVRRSPAAGEKLRRLKPTYQQRRDELEQAQVRRAEQLLQYLRLQAHTGRPCVGLIHFRRRLAYSHKQLAECSWLSDLVNCDPLMLVNHLRSSQVLLNDGIATVHMYSTLRRFNVDLQLPYSAHPTTLHTEVPVDSVLNCLRDQPLLLGAFLWQLVTNSVSPQLLSRIFRQIDWELPGQLDRSYWRRPFVDEIAHPHFLVQETQRYRGPVYQRHRFVSSCYFLAELYTSAQHDIRIALKSPVDGKFAEHQYRGRAMFVHISRAELCALIGKVAVRAELVPGSMLGTLLLLHPHNLHLLFALLLELVHLSVPLEQEPHSAPTHHSHHHTQQHNLGEVRHHHHHHRGVPVEPTSASDLVSGRFVLEPLTDSTAQQFDVAVSLPQLRDRLCLMLEKFNHWVTGRHAQEMSPLGADFTDSVQLQLARLSVSPQEAFVDPQKTNVLTALYNRDIGEVPFTVRMERDPSNKQQMRVYHSVWAFPDLDKFYGDPMQHARRDIEVAMLQARSGVSCRLLRSLREFNATGAVNNARKAKFPTFTPASAGCDSLESLMGVEVMTNVSKTRLLIEISPVDLGHHDAKQIVSAHEQAMLREEDQLSAQLRTSSAVLAARQAMDRRLRQLEQTLHTKLLPQHETLERRNQQMLATAHSLQKHFTSTYEHSKVRHAQSLATLALSLLTSAGAIHRPASAISSMMRATVTPVRLPGHLSSNDALMKLAAWVNDTLRHHHRSLPSVSTTNLRFICDNLQGAHSSTASMRNVADKYSSPPAFTTETLPRSERVSDTSGPSALEQLGGGFRDPDRWYHARRMRPRPIIPKRPPCETETDQFPVDCSAALRSHKLVSAMRLTAVLSPAYDAAEPLVDARSDPQYVVREVLGQEDASVTFQLLDLLSSATVSLRAVCSTDEPKSPQLPPQSALLRTLASLVAAVEEQIHTGNAARIEEINATTAEIEQCHAHFRALTAVLRVSWEDAQPVLAAASAITLPSYSSMFGVSAPVAAADVGHALQPSTPVAALTHKSRKHARRSRKHRTESDDYSVKSAELPTGFIGFLVPQDESLPYQELSASTVADWQEMMGRHLLALPSALTVGENEGVREVRLLRHLSPFAIMYCREEPETHSGEDHHHAHRHRHHQHRHHKAQKLQEETVNTRAMALLAQFSDSVLSGAPPTAVASRGHRQPAPPALCGDVVLLLRHGHRHFTALEAALRAMVEAYAPMRALRLQKEGREKLWRLSNHQQFRLLVCGLSYACMRAVERMYSVLKPAIPASANPFPAPVNRVNELPVYQTRLILTRFDDLRSRHAGHSAGSGEDWWRALGCMGLLDYAVVVQRDSLLVHFDEQCPAGIDFGDFDCHNPHLHSMLSDAQSATDSSSSSDEGLFYLSAPSADSSAIRTPIFTAGQVVYAMYQLHCYNCQLPTHICRFPGCGAIRNRALAEMGALEPVLEHSQGASYLGDLCLPSPTEGSNPDLQRVRGSGLHPIDVAVKEHLFQSTSRLFTLMPPLRVAAAVELLGATDTVSLPDTAEQHDMTVEEEVRREQSWDQAVVAKHERDVRLRLRWQELQREAALCHALHNAMIRPELAQCFTARELILAKGGIHAQEEIAAIRKLVTHALVTQSAAAHGDYTAYSSTADSQLLRLVPSAAMLEQQQQMLEEEGGMHGEGVEHEEESVTVGSQETHSESSSTSSSGSSGSSSEYSDSEQSGEFTESSAGTSVASAEQLDLAVTVRKRQTHSIPISLLRALSTATLDPSDSSLSEFDPYPSSHQHHHHRRATNAMPHAMYTLLMQRLRLTRRDRLPVPPSAPQPRSSVIVTGSQSRKGSAFATKIIEMAASQTEDHCFRFDRLYCEQAAVLQDGSNVLVQCLHGVLEGASLVVLQRPPVRGRPRLFLSDDVFPNIEVHDTASGAPPAAVRFLETDRLPRLRLGMTVVVFDILSTVSRAFIIEQRSLKRTCEAFGVGPEDYGGLARSICSRAHRCVYLARAGLYCTSVMFSVASLHEQTTAAAVAVPAVEVEQASTEQSPSLEDSRTAAVQTALVMVSDRYLTRPGAALSRFSALSSFLAEA